jgi:molybdopterin-containing oxidoreductase family iron-sulfur binding subunit
VETCPVQALRFGDVEDPESPISAFIRERSPWRLLEEAGTEPSVMYVGGKPPSREVREIERPKARV